MEVFKFPNNGKCGWDKMAINNIKGTTVILLINKITSLLTFVLALRWKKLPKGAMAAAARTRMSPVCNFVSLGSKTTKAPKTKSKHPAMYPADKCSFLHRLKKRNEKNDSVREIILALPAVVWLRPIKRMK